MVVAPDGSFLADSHVEGRPTVNGDISPVSPAARTLAWMEAVTGQFYLAVIVAGLMSVLAAKGKREGVP